MITLTEDAVLASTTQSLAGGVLAEQYYSLVHLLRPTGDAADGLARTVGVSSCAPGAGASTVAVNLAMAAAQTGDRPALLLDLSSTRPALAARLGMSGDLGLRKALSGQTPAAECVRETPVRNLSLLGVNEPGGSSLVSIESGRIHDLLRSLERGFSFIVVDLPVTDSGLCVAAASLLDGVVLVLESERTSSHAALRAKQRLVQSNARLLGVILNKHDQHLPNWLVPRI